ncbi:MAG TPA: CocE/NonD family hydrolase, partial [Acidobacteriaceae bacterium]|nr:CocE/NonD family hydrolase [Acidobacteriaceae bacterium]
RFKGRGSRVQRKRAVTVATVGLAVAVLLCVATWPAVKAHLQALCVLDSVSGQKAPWFASVVTTQVTTEDVTFEIHMPAGPRSVRARMYEPKGRPNAPGMVIFHGVHHLGIDEPRLMGFARAMAACGIRVLTPELPGIKDYHVDEDSIATIGESVKWMAKRVGAPVGVMGLSFAGGLALVAAEDPVYAPAFKFVFAVGAQDSMARVTEYYRTGRDVRPDGTVETLAPHEYGPLVIEYEHLDDFVPPEDLAAVQAVMRAHLYEDKAAEAQASLALNEAQKRETQALMDATSAETRLRIASVLVKYAAEVGRLSPGDRLKTLKVPVYLLHGEGDNVIPAAETLWMANDLPPTTLGAMLVSPVLSHVNLDGPSPGARDEWQLMHFFAEVMQAAEHP